MLEGVALFSTPAGMTLIGMVAAVSIILWDWRAALLAVLFVQASVAALTVDLFDVPGQWALIQVAVMALACLILALSAVQTMQQSLSARQAGSLPLRLMAVLFFTGTWILLDYAPSLPKVGPEASGLFGWLVVCAVLMLGMGTNPLYSGVALLLWFVPVQALVAVVLGIPALVALTGILELLVALVCSYLLLAEQAPSVQPVETLTDISFPTGPVETDRERVPAWSTEALRRRLGSPRQAAAQAGNDPRSGPERSTGSGGKTAGASPQERTGTP